MDRVLKVAIPPLAATVVVPLRTPPPGLAAMGTGTLDESPVTRLLRWSSTRSVIGGLMAGPAAAVLGCVPKTRWSAVAGVMLKELEVAPPRLLSLADSV